AAEQREGRELQRLERCGNDEQLPAGLEAFDGAGDGLAVRRGRQHEVRSSKLLQSCGGGTVGGVDVLVRAELLRELPLVGATRDRDSPETHLRGELDGEVSEAADALDGHGVPRTRAAVAERVVGSDASAEQGSGVLGVELLGDPRGGFVRDDDVLCVTAIETDARYLRPLAASSPWWAPLLGSCADAPPTMAMRRTTLSCASSRSGCCPSRRPFRRTASSSSSACRRGAGPPERSGSGNRGLSGRCRWRSP